MPIGLAADHGGYEVKEFLKQQLTQLGYDVTDYGTRGTDAVDYPDVARLVAEGILDHTIDTGIVICGSGIGVSIMANRYPGVRCALCLDTTYAQLARSHNNANVLALGGRFLTPEQALHIAKTFLTTPSEGGRHDARVAKLDQI